MTTNATREQEPDASVDERRDTQAVAKRISRAFDEFFHIEASEDAKYTVFSGSGNTYTVTMSEGACTCPDGQRGAWCKHAFRVAFVTGEIPTIDGVTGESDARNNHTDSEPTETEDDTDTLTERVERYKAQNPGASAIEAISQLGINPEKKERVEEVLA